MELPASSTDAVTTEDIAAEWDALDKGGNAAWADSDCKILLIYALMHAAELRDGKNLKYVTALDARTQALGPTSLQSWLSYDMAVCSSSERSIA
jgi:hypothetical protein